MEFFFKLIRKHSAEIGSQKEREQRENRAYIMPAAGPVRLTGVHKAGSVDRSVDRCAQTCTG